MDIKGKFVEIFDTVQVSDKFKKREFVVEYAENPQYPEYVKFELIQDKCDIVDSYSIGQEVEVFFNVKGRKWTDPKGETKYFNSLQAWKIQSAVSKTQDNFGKAVNDQNSDSWPTETENEDLPF